eukprot:2749948-Amphidinium_carterae.1
MAELHTITKGPPSFHCKRVCAQKLQPFLCIDEFEQSSVLFNMLEDRKRKPLGATALFCASLSVGGSGGLGFLRSSFFGVCPGCFSPHAGARVARLAASQPNLPLEEVRCLCAYCKSVGGTDTAHSREGDISWSEVAWEGRLFFF